MTSRICFLVAFAACAPEQIAEPPPPFDLAGFVEAPNGELLKVVDHADVAMPAAAGGSPQPVALDGRCSLGPLAGVVSSTYVGKRCCQEHDKCYARDGHECSAWSWSGIEGFACMGCNLRAIGCFATGSLVFGSPCDDWYNECSYRSHEDCSEVRCGGDPVCAHDVCEVELGYEDGDHWELVDQGQPSGWNDGWYYSQEEGWHYVSNANCWINAEHTKTECEVNAELRPGFGMEASGPCDNFAGFINCYLQLAK